MPSAETAPEPSDPVVDVLVSASRALVAVAARSLAAIGDDVTLPQYRALVVLAAGGHRPVGVLADALDIAPSTATRLCDRLVAKRLVRRERSEASRREVEVSLTAKGRRLVDGVTARRRAELERIVGHMDPADAKAAVAALQAFATAAGEPPDDTWTSAWSLP